MSASAAETRQALAEMMRARRGEKGRPVGLMIGISLAVAALLALVAYLILWLSGFFATDPRLVEVRAMQQEQVKKFAATGGPTNVLEAVELVTSMATINQKVNELPENMRGQAQQDGGKLFMTAMQKRMDNYFDLPAEQRQAELDKQIDQGEFMRKAWETGQSAMKAVGLGGTGGQSAGGGPPAGGPPAGGPPGQAGGARTEEERNKWRKDMIDKTSPEQRSRWTEYIRAMQERREQRGLPPGGPPR